MWRPFFVVVSLWLLIGGSLWWLLAISYGELLLVLVGMTVCVFVFSRLGGDEAADTDSESVWNAIPSWQYNGRHAESGGLARGEQEQALQEIHDDAQRHDE